MAQESVFEPQRLRARVGVDRAVRVRAADGRLPCGIEHPGIVQLHGDTLRVIVQIGD
jgi:hypothetical protein